MRLRSILFWTHLAAGLIAGVSIAIMCFTGTALAFEKELIAWAERDARRVEPPASDAPRLALDELQRRLRDAHPDVRPATIVVQNDPHAAVAFSTGRTGAYHINPYTGEIRQPRSTAMAAFMHTMVDWHRYLNLHGETARPRGKLINGICNVAFCVLAVTGLYLWMPRSWSWRSVRGIALFNTQLAGKARDFNWHNAIGLWTAPVLIVLTLTAMPISFRWAGNLLFTLTGTPAPGAPGAPGAAPAIEVPKPPEGALPLSQDALFTAAQTHVPAWQTITLRLAGGRPGTAAAPGRSEATAITFTLRERGTWPRTATTTLALDPFTGKILRRAGYADLNAAQRTRAWTRFLHTGEAVGWLGQLIAGLACAGGLVLVYTGFALAWRRFFRRSPSDPALSSRTEPSAVIR